MLLNWRKNCETRLAVVDGEGEDFEGLLVGAEEKESAIFTIYAKAVNALRFWFEEFDMETWVFWIFR